MGRNTLPQPARRRRKVLTLSVFVCLSAVHFFVINVRVASSFRRFVVIETSSRTHRGETSKPERNLTRRHRERGVGGGVL